MKLLVVAPRVGKHAIGESQIAYQWLSRLVDRHDVTVLTHRMRHDGPLGDELAGARIIEWTEPPLVGRHERFNAMLNPGYMVFHVRARRWIRAALARGESWDVAHQLGPVSLRFPSPLAGFPVPYVWGPLGGSLRSPEAFRAEEGGAPWFTALRALDGFRLRRDPVLRRSLRSAACVVGIADYVRDLLSDIDIRSFRTLSDAGIETMPPRTALSDRTTDLRLLFVGRVIRTKGVRDAISALALLPAGTARLDVVGDGYDRPACEELTARLGVADLVTFHGHVPHDRVGDHYARADVFLFPSYREAGGIAVVEALSYGLPAIVCDRGGPASTVDDTCGLRITARDPHQYAHALADAVAALAADPARRAAMSTAARARIESIGLWDGRVTLIEELYREVLDQSRTQEPGRQEAPPGGAGGRGVR